MPTANTPLLGLALPITGDLSGSWGDEVNNAITSLLDDAVAGTTSITVDADITLTTTVLAANQARQAIIRWNPAAGTTTRNITAPAQSKIYTVINASGGTQSIVFRGVGPTTGVTIVKGESAVVAWNGTDFIKVSNTGGSASFTNVTVSGTTTLSNLTASTALALDASKNVVSVTNTGTGNNVLATSPTLVTPALGTPSSVTLTNATGLPISTGVSGLGTDVATALAVNVGTAGSPVVNGGVLGTPSSGTLTNATGLPVSTGISGLGTGVATALAVNVGSAGAPVINGGVLGTPSSGTVTNLTGTASININGTVGATTANTGAFTTLTSSSGATIQGLTVGRGAGAVAGNTTVGASALASNTTGDSNAAIGFASLFSNIDGNYNTGVGANSGVGNVSGDQNTSVGYFSLYANASGNNNTVIGYSAGASALGSGNVMFGNRAGLYETGSNSFYVDNQDRTNTAGDKAGALLYGTFNATPASQTLTTNAKLTATYGVVARVNSQTTIASPWAWDSTLYDQQEITALANALTINADAGTPSNGQQTVFRFTDDGTARALTWTTGTSKSFRSVGTPLPTTTVASKTLYVACIYNSTAARWDVVAVAQET